MKRNIYFLAIAALVCFALAGQSQAIAQDVHITATLLNQNIRVFFLSDFNFTGNTAATGEVFEIVMSNSSAQPQQCFLTVNIRSQSQGPLASGRTKPFTIEPMHPIRITNRNLFTQAQNFSLDDYTIENAGDELKDNILATGKLPSDFYIFEFVLTQMTTGYTSTATITIDVTNPSTLDLISPGANATDEVVPTIMTRLPYFRWESNISKFRLVIAEKLRGVHAGMSPEEIIQDRIIFERTFTVVPSGAVGTTLSDGSTAIPSTGYQYASSDHLLQEGRTYLWQVIGITETPGGPVDLPSEIWAFKIGSSSDQTLSMQQRQLIDNLSQLLGDRWGNLFGSNGDLEGFTPTGVMFINGQPISPERMQAILNNIFSGRYEIISMTIE